MLTLEVLSLSIHSLKSVCTIHSAWNYATRDSSGMCHLMPQWHLSGWREEDESGSWVSNDRGSWVSNKGLDNTMPATVNWFARSHFKVIGNTLETLWQTQLGVTAWFRLKLPQCTNAAHPPLSTLADAAVATGGTCLCSPEWHFPVYASEIWIKSYSPNYTTFWALWGKNRDFFFIIIFDKGLTLYWKTFL